MIVLKTINDYVEELSEIYPNVDKKDIKKIIQYGWKQMYLLNSYGGDVVINTGTLWCYFGKLCFDSIKHFKYYIKKLSIKFRVLYKRRNIEWDGYYYFALTDNQYNEYLSLIKPTGKKKRIFTFNKIILYKILDDCKIKEFNKKYIFKISMPIETNYTIFKNVFIAHSPELIIIRETLKFKDILINNNNYLLL